MLSKCKKSGGSNWSYEIRYKEEVLKTLGLKGNGSSVHVQVRQGDGHTKYWVNPQENKREYSVNW